LKITATMCSGYVIVVHVFWHKQDSEDSLKDETAHYEGSQESLQDWKQQLSNKQILICMWFIKHWLHHPCRWFVFMVKILVISQDFVHSQGIIKRED